MIILWKIHYIDRTNRPPANERQFKDRCLYVDTESLPADTRATLEFLVENNSSDRRFLQFRTIFLDLDKEGGRELPSGKSFKSVFLENYFEDENGLSVNQASLVEYLTGNFDAVMIPSGVRAHDIDLMLAQKRPLPVDTVELSDTQLRILCLFARDAKSLASTALLREGPGRLTLEDSITSLPNGKCTLETAASHDEIHAAVLIFRKLLMAGEPGNFKNAASAFLTSIGDHRISRWIQSEAADIETTLLAPPNLFPFARGCSVSFTTRRLIDVFLYTQFVHQPDLKREKQFKNCLAQVSDNKAFLMWLFLWNVHTVGTRIANMGKVIDQWLAKYFNHRGLPLDAMELILSNHTGIGALEKNDARRIRQFREKVVQLAQVLWEQAGRPPTGPLAFMDEADKAIRKNLGD